MPDKKLTDKEIIKACKDCLHYEACKGTYSSAKGEEDILYNFDGEMYANSGCEDFIDKDLITRQQAEIERLTAVKGHIDTLIHRGIEYPTAEAYEKAFQKALEHLYDNVNAKTEAYKEFAERLKNSIKKSVDDAWHSDGNGIYDAECVLDDIDNLLKEMVGDN